MKILFVSSRFPYPALKGDQVILYNRLKHLSKRHEITLLTFYQRDQDLEGLERVRQFCAKIETVKIGRLQAIWNLLSMGLFSRLPLQTLYFRSSKFERALERILAATDFNIVHTYLLRMAEYTRRIDKPRVVDLIDSMQLNLEKRLVFVKNPQKILYREELGRIKPYEKEIVDECDAAIVVSETDRDYIASDNVTAIPLGIDLLRFRRDSPLPDNKTMIFSGNMGYYPNESAILWFLENCFAEIKRSVPGVRLKVVGINPGSNVKKYHDGKAIIVTGFVESIVDEMTSSQMAIAPMQSGYGMHIKILEAMACGLPVVTTSPGKGSISAENRVHLIAENDSSSFAEACIGLLNNREAAESMGQNARSLIIEKYGWESSVSELEKFYEAIIKRKVGEQQ